MAGRVEIPRSEYEQRVLKTLRELLLEGEPLIEREGRVTVEDVRLDTSRPLHRIHILFRESSRPGCLFGYRAEAVEDPIILDPQEGYWGPEDWAGVILVTNFEEQVEAINLGLPPDCDPGGITWINGYRRLPPARVREVERELTLEELDALGDEWERGAVGRLACSLDRDGWLAFGIGRSLTGSAREGSDFRYHVIAYSPVVEAVREGREPVFELYDEKREVVAYVREVPTPERAAELLERHGIPVEEGDRIRAGLPDVPEGILRDV